MVNIYHQKSLLSLIILVLSLFILTGCFGGSSESIPPEKRITRVGYWKMDNNRVFTYSIGSQVNEAEVKRHARNAMHTSGKITYVFYYKSDTPNIPNPTTANSFDRALMITERVDAVYSFSKFGNGTISESEFNL